MLAVSCALFLTLAGARADDAVPYQKLVGSTFVSDLDGKPITVVVVYDGVADSNIVGGIYKNAKINVKDKVFLVHHDPSGQPGTPVIAGASVQPPFAISIPKSDADAVLALQPGTTITVVGTVHKSVFGMLSARTLSNYIEATSVTAVPSASP